MVSGHEGVELVMDDDLDGMTEEERKKALAAMRKFAEQTQFDEAAFGLASMEAPFGETRTDQAADAPLAQAVRGLSAIDLIDRKFKR